MRKDKEPSIGDVRQAKALARRIIEHHFGNKPKRIVHQASGLSNFVFIVSHAEGGFVVRISPDPTKINLYIKEQWAVGKANEVGVPTSETLEVGNDIVPHPFMVSRVVKGREATYHPERLSILHEMGRFAALINSIQTTGFGNIFDWSNNQLSRNKTFKDFLHNELQIDARLEVLKKHRMVSQEKLKELRLILKRVTKKRLRPALNHGDIRLKNVMVDDDGKITAIIDLETCMSNLAPHWELSLTLHDLSIDEKQEFLDGYRWTYKKLREIAPVIKALNIINYAPHIENLIEANNKSQLEKYRARLGGALDLYSL